MNEAQRSPKLLVLRRQGTVRHYYLANCARALGWSGLED
jgi:hypothetical protein